MSALLAVQVAAAFLPVSSGGADDSFSMVICSAEGARTITLSDSDLGDGTSQQPALHGHCPLCVLAADLPSCVQTDTGFERIATALDLRIVAGPQTRPQAHARPGAIRAPPFTVSI
ncbi:hypothetical protein OO012_02680 [Rhodobacteraceae bacterium KMM 6894]|nr:hypothetical protein [Rhodobacteraceae bacterium KMM 6894]